MISTVTRDQEAIEIFETINRFSIEQLQFFVSMLKGDDGFTTIIGLLETKIALLISTVT